MLGARISSVSLVVTVGVDSGAITIAMVGAAGRILKVTAGR